MYSKILVSSTLLSICSGSSLKHAVSSVSFHRNDVPLSYNFSQIHIYATDKPNDKDQHSPVVNRSRRLPQPLNYENFQYAPLTINHKNQQTDDIHTPHTTDEASNQEAYYNSEDHKKKSNIEPHFREDDYNYQVVTPKSLVSGHNIAVQTNANNIMNPFEPTFQNTNTMNKHDKIRDFQIMNNFIEQDYLKIKAPPVSTVLEAIEMHEIKQNNAQNKFIDETFYKQLNTGPNRYEGLQAIQNGELQLALSSFVKTPRVHLNVARSYNLAQLPHKASPNIIQNSPNKKQTLFIQGNKAPLEHKTILHPLQYSNNYVLRRLGI